MLAQLAQNASHGYNLLGNDYLGRVLDLIGNRIYVLLNYMEGSSYNQDDLQLRGEKINKIDRQKSVKIEHYISYFFF